MNWIDFVIIGFIALSALYSLRRGFTEEVLSLVILVCAFFVAGHFSGQLSSHLSSIQDSTLRNGASWVILFILTLVVGAVFNNFFSFLVNKAGLSSTNMVLGVVFGAMRGVAIIAAVLFFLDAFTHLPKTDGWARSQLIPHFSSVISWFFAYVEQNSSFLPKMP